MINIKKAIFISTVGHLAVFSLFNLSFGSRIPVPNYTSVSFWGQVLGNAQIAECRPKKQEAAGLSFPDGYLLSALEGNRHPQDEPLPGGIKPQLNTAPSNEKGTFPGERSRTIDFSRARQEPVIIFHPLLPYSFPLYFQDRQVAHVELMFNIELGSSSNSIVVRRKISSGNLEVDLLSARYIGRYLFMQSARFIPNKWQAVKIDLAAQDG